MYLRIASILHLISPSPGVADRNQKQLPHGAGLFAHGVENADSPAAKIQAHPSEHPMTLHVEEDDIHGSKVSLRHKKAGVLVGHLSERNSTKDIFLNFRDGMKKHCQSNLHSDIADVCIECCYTGVWTERTRRPPVGFGVQGVIEISFFVDFGERPDYDRAVVAVAELQQVADASREFGMFEITPCIDGRFQSSTVRFDPSRVRAVTQKRKPLPSWHQIGKRRNKPKFTLKCGPPPFGGPTAPALRSSGDAAAGEGAASGGAVDDDAKAGSAAAC